MFTGIVLGVGRVVARTPSSLGERLTLDLGEHSDGVLQGESIAVNGVCLTATSIEGAEVGFDLAGETLRVTNLGELQPGSAVNLERSLRMGDRLDGHLVQGHVDGVGRIRTLGPRGEDHWLVVEAVPDLVGQMLLKGSVAVDGISLTVAELGDEHFACTIVPHTLVITNLGERELGAAVNLEVDSMGKWVRRIVEQTLAANPELWRGRG